MVTFLATFCLCIFFTFSPSNFKTWFVTGIFRLQKVVGGRLIKTFDLNIDVDVGHFFVLLLFSQQWLIFF
jgi:hypothetical protein